MFRRGLRNGEKTRMFRAPQRSRRLTRILSGIAATAVLAVASIGVTATATATPVTGYVATGDTADFDAHDGAPTLPFMTEGVAYSATITGPTYTTWCWSISGTLPTGITISPDGGCAASVTFSGTPEVAGEEFSFELIAGDMPERPEVVRTLSFAGTVESGKTPTITTLDAPEVAAYDSIQLSATVAGDPTGIPTGSVEFRIGSDVIGTGTLSGGMATATADVDLADVGTSPTITAHYLGDDEYAVSASDGSAVLIYAPTATGEFVWNGIPVEDASVALLRGTDVIATDVTDAAGEFSLGAGPITTIADATATYVVRVQLSPTEYFYYAAGEFNVEDPLDADATGPTDWGTTLVIERRTGPRFTDDGLRTPREGTPYSDGVAATGRGTITYSISAGSLPAGLTLNPTTGAVTGTPSACTRDPETPFPFAIVYSWLRSLAPSCDYDFTIMADNGYGDVDERFTGTVLEAGVAPTWEDEELPEFRVDVAVDDEVLADGDPTIVYSISAGTLPAGLSLNAATGAVTGTPTTAGPYAFTVTAENDFGSITTVFEGDVEAAPALGLVLEFDEGTSIEDAGSTISAEGLQVGSTYTLTMYSTPRVLYTGTVDATGGFTWLVALPADTPVGPHRLVLTGIAANGTPMSATAWFSLRADGRIGAISYTGPVGGGLAHTGVNALYAGLAGGVLLLVGTGAVLSTWRPRRSMTK